MLLPYLPNHQVLRPGAFKPVAGTDKKRLTLACTSSAVLSLRGNDIHGVDEVQYLIDTKDSWTDPRKSLKIDPRVPPVGEQSASSVLAFYQAVNPRRSGNTVIDGNFTFDFRSTCYVLGAITSQCSSGVATVWGRDCLPSYSLLSPSHTLTFSNNPMVNQMMWKDNNEFITLMAILGLSGAEDVAIPGDVAPRRGCKLTGRTLGSYALKLYAVIMSMANSTKSSISHAQAFFEGQCSVWRLNAHTDESGFIRGPLIKKSYPHPRGALLPGTAEILGLSTVRSVEPSEITVWCVASFLESAGRVARADPTLVDGVPSIYKREGGSDVPSSYPGLEQGFYQLMSNWRRLTAAESGLIETDFPDNVSSRVFFDADAEDRHLDQEFLIPFFWVEPSGLSTGGKSAIKCPAVQGQGGSLPLLDGVKGIKTKAYSEYKGRVGCGSKIFLYAAGGHQARGSGIHYIFSSRYRKENGLSQFESVVSSRLGVVNSDFAMADNRTGMLSQMRWETPHNCLPNPAELYTERRACFRYTYSGARDEPTISDFENADVDFTISPLYIPKVLDGSTKSIHKDVPEHLHELVSITNRNRKLHFGAEEDEFEDGYERVLDGAVNPVPPAVDPGELTPAKGQETPLMANEDDFGAQQETEMEEVEPMPSSSGGLVRVGVDHINPGSVVRRNVAPRDDDGDAGSA